MSIDLTKLSPAPWESVTILPAGSRETGDGGYESWSESPWRVINGPPQAIRDDMLSRRAFTNATDAEFIAMARHDLDVRQRRGWHAELQTDGEWYVPQISAQARAIGKTAAWLKLGMFEATRQFGHDVGLLTKADKWYKENVEKESTK